MNQFIAAMQNYAVFEGRSARPEFWYFKLFSLLIIAAASLIDAASGATILYLIAVLVFIIPDIAVSVRRLHDIDRSGWWYLVAFVPLFGLILLIVFWCQPGSPGDNRFGARPPAQEPAFAPPPLVSAPAQGSSIAELERLTALRASGAITEAEFERLKARIIGP